MEETKPFTIKHWAEEDRPRERLLLKGRHALTETELLAILLRTGTRKKSAVELARHILSRCNNDLNELAKLSVQDFLKIFKGEGIGKTKAITIIAALELGRRRNESGEAPREKIISSRDIFQLMIPHFRDLPHEEFHILLLNRRNYVIRKEKVSAGGVSSTLVDPKIIFRKAMEFLASSVILCHNHPSGSVTPSEEDIRITKKLREAGSQLEIPVLDHLIISDKEYYSFADNGMM